MSLEFGLAHRSADADRAVADLYAIESGKPHDVDQDARPRHAHVKERNERLPAGENACVRTFLVQHVECLVEALGAHIIKRSGLHERPRFRGARSGSGP